MARTTQELVETVITNEDEGDWTAYIDTASSLVDELCTSSGYSDARLELIERWLSAHFADINSPRTSQEQVGGGGGTTSETFEKVAVDLWLNNTKYGQQAMMLDTAGNLAAVNNSLGKVTGGKRDVQWLGTPARDTPAYWE